MRIRWSVPSGTLESVEGFYIGYKVVDDTSTNERPYSFKTMDVSKEHDSKPDFETVLNDLQRNSRYNIIIQAFNKKGPGPSSDDVVAQTLEFGTSSLLLSLCFCSFLSSTLTLFPFKCV